MTWIDRLKSIISRFVAVQLREIVRSRTAATLSRLDDRLLLDIGVPRNRIAEYAREVAHMTVPVPPMPTSVHKSVTERLRSWRMRRAAIRELSTLDERLLRDIGIEPGRADDFVEAVLSRRRGLSTAHPAVQFSDAMQQIFVPVRHRPSVPAMPRSDSRTPKRNGNRATIRAERMPDVRALRARAANDDQSPEMRHRAAAEM